jgi:hypothetical protein
LVGSRIYNRGVDVRHIARISRQDIRTFQVRAFNSPRDMARRHGDRDFVGVYRPRFAALSQGNRFSPRLTAPDAIENARRSRTSLHDDDRDDARERGRTRRFESITKDDQPSGRSPRSIPPPVADTPRLLPSPDETKRARERSAKPPPLAKLSPPPSTDDGPRSFRGRSLDRPPSAFVNPPPQSGDDNSRSFRSRSFDRPPSAIINPPPNSDDASRRSFRAPGGDGPPAASLRSQQQLQLRESLRAGDGGRSLSSRSDSPRLFQPQPPAPSRAIQAPPPFVRSAPGPDRSAASNVDRGSRRGDRERDRSREGRPPG